MPEILGHFFLWLWYSRGMFRIAKQAEGYNGSFVRLVRLDTEDFTVIIRRPEDGRLQNKYIGPDPVKAEEVFHVEAAKLAAGGREH